MHSKGLMASAFALAVLFVMAMAAPSWAALKCTGPIGAVEINGDVSAGPGCDLSGATVRGNVTVNPGGSLSTNRDLDEPPKFKTLITGNVKSSEATEVVLNGPTSIEGDVQLKGTGTGAGSTGGQDSPAFLFGGTVKGNVDIEGGEAEARAGHETVGGNVDILNNSSAIGAGFSFMAFEAITVGGNLEIGNNSSTGEFENRFEVGENSVAGNLRVYDNSLPDSETINGNFLFVYRNHVGINAEILNNFIQAFDMVVSANVVTNILNCLGNKPPPQGRLNTAKQKLGQCALL